MKNTVAYPDTRTELLYLKRQIELAENKFRFTNEPKLLDALSFELLGLRSRLGYLLDIAKKC